MFFVDLLQLVILMFHGGAPGGRICSVHSFPASIQPLDQPHQYGNPWRWSSGGLGAQSSGHCFNSWVASIESQNSLRTLVQSWENYLRKPVPLFTVGILELCLATVMKIVSQTAVVLTTVQVAFGCDLLAVPMPGPK